MKNQSAATQPQILIVDDEPYNLIILEEYLTEAGFKVESAKDGDEAWKKILRYNVLYDLVLLDWMMPKMSGLEILKKIHSSQVLINNQVIMQTARAKPSEIQRGINAGAYYYLTKPFNSKTLLAIVKTALLDRKNYLHAQRSIMVNNKNTLSEKRFVIRGLEEAYNIAGVLSSLCPNPIKRTAGFIEMLLNAIEHGNLGITYSEKSALLAEGMWEEEINKRLTMPEFNKKLVEINYKKTDKGFLQFTIQDEGGGFDWEKYLTLDPKRALHTHGRGIAMSSLSFNSISYTGNGNCVKLNIKL